MLLLGIYVFKLSSEELQVLMFLKMAVAGHMTIYLTRSGRRHFWERPLPAARLFFTTETTQILATILVIYGMLMVPLPAVLAIFVWMYAIAFLFINDAIKVWFLKRRERKSGLAMNAV